MLVFEFDVGGLDVIKQPIIRVTPTELKNYCKKSQEELPQIIAVEFGSLVKREMDLSAKSYDPTTALNFLDSVNNLVREGCNWKTIVVDPITGLTEAFIGYVGTMDSKAMDDARNWAHKVGVLIQRTIMVVQGLQAHTVFLLHCDVDKNELTGEITMDPMVPSKLRQRIASLFSQFFYATIEGGKAYVYAQPVGFVKSVGMRKPDMATAKMGALFGDIYGSEDKI